MDTLVRDITAEAKALAKQEIILQYPYLSDRVTRQRLQGIEKMMILTQLSQFYDFFEAKLLGEIQASHKEPSML